jgi:hypothetical protein
LMVYAALFLLGQVPAFNHYYWGGVRAMQEMLLSLAHLV